jgi:hypothetical protein
MGPGNGHAGPAAYRTCAARHEERVRGTTDQLERVVRGWERDIRGAGVVEGVLAILDLTRVRWGGGRNGARGVALRFTVAMSSNGSCLRVHAGVYERHLL